MIKPYIGIEDIANEVDTAITHQWVRDNKENLAWLYAGVEFRELTPSLLDFEDNIKRCVVFELGEKLCNDWLNRRENPKQLEELGLEKCWFCKTMFADPVDSDAQGGHLCQGCMRWWDKCHKESPYIAHRPGGTPSDHVGLNMDCMEGRQIMRRQIAKKLAEFKQEEYERQERELARRVNEQTAKVMKPMPKKITIDPDYEYDKQAIEELEDRRNNSGYDRTY